MRKKNSRTPLCAAFVVLATASLTGCASRATPFDQLDRAQVTIYRLQAAQQTPQTPTSAFPFPLPPGFEQPGQALMQAIQQAQNSGIIPPIPGLLPAQPSVPRPTAPLFRGQWQVADQRPVMDEATRQSLLDLFGNAENFNNQRGNCFNVGMAVSFSAPPLEPVDVVASVSCNTVAGYGFQWPHQNNYGMTRATNQELVAIFQSLFGAPPAS